MSCGKGFYAILLAAWLFLLPSLRAQQPSVREYTLPEPWSASRVDALFSDPSGLLWLGGAFGLASYDGYGFRFLSGSKPIRRVTAIAMDGEGALWVGHADGHISAMAPNGDSLILWTGNGARPRASVNALIHRGRQLWIGTYGDGVWVREDGRLQRLDAETGIPSEEPYALVADASGRIWMGSDEGLGEIVQEASGRLRYRPVDTRAFPDRIVKALLPDPQGQLWIGFHSDGIARYDPKNQRLEIPVRNWKLGPVERLALPEGDELWIGTSDRGIWRLDQRLRALSGTDCSERTLPSRVGLLLADRSGNLWASSRTSGLWSMHTTFSQASGAPRKVQAVLAEPSGILWAGTDNGLWRLEYAEHCGWTWPERPTLLAGKNVISLALDHRNTLWAGTFGQGLARIDRQQGQARLLTEADGLPNGNILSIRPEGDTLWLTTLGGIATLSWADTRQRPEFDRFSERVGLPSPFVYCSHRDPKGTLWFGTDGKGLSGLRPDGTLLSFREADGQAVQSVYALCGAGAYGMLVGTERGLLSFDGQRFRALALRPGHTDPAVMGLAPIADGRILVAFDRGLALFDPATGQLLPIDPGTDLGVLNPNLHALSAAGSAHAWVGTEKGIVRLALPASSQWSIPLILHAEAADGRHLAAKERLAASDNTITFRFAGVWYAYPDAVRYRIRLDGYDREWQETRDRQAIYTRLPPGEYVFRVQTSTGGPFDALAERSFAFQVSTPFYKRWWFIAWSALAFAGLAFAGIRYRESRIRRQAGLRRERLEMQFEVLKSQINPHFLFNSLNSLLAIIEKDPREAARFVEDLSEFFRSVLTFRERESIPLKEEIAMAEHYGRLLSRRFGPALDLRIEVPDTRGMVVPLTLQLLVENAVKHNVASISKPLTVTIARTDDRLLVHNPRQPKQAVEPSTGIGLHNLRAQYQLLSDRPLEVTDKPTSFTVSVPILPEP